MAKSRLYGIRKQKCPRCLHGDLFTSKNPYNLKDLGKMPPVCPTCGQDFVMEPGFYFGSTYISYGITVAFLVAGFLANWLTFNWELEVSGTILVSVFILLSPIVFRISRTIWIYFFVKYDSTVLPKGDS